MNIRVYYEDTDSGGVVYHSNYLNFMERARTEWLRNLGINQKNLKLKENIIFVVAAINIQYKGSATLDDELYVSTGLTGMKSCSLSLHQEILKDKEIITTGDIKVACLNAIEFDPIKIPMHIKKLMESI